MPALTRSFSDPHEIPVDHVPETSLTRHVCDTTYYCRRYCSREDGAKHLKPTSATPVCVVRGSCGFIRETEPFSQLIVSGVWNREGQVATLPSRNQTQYFPTVSRIAQIQWFTVFPFELEAGLFHKFFCDREDTGCLTYAAAQVRQVIDVP